MKSPRYSIVARRVLRARRLPIVLSYALSLLTTIGMLVFFVVYVLRSPSRVAELAASLGLRGENVHWTVLWIGCIAGCRRIGTLTYHAAWALSAPIPRVATIQPLAAALSNLQLLAHTMRP